MMQKLLATFILIFSCISICAQTYNIVIKDGRVIDPKNNINEVMDVAISNGKIALVAKNIDPSKAMQDP